MFGGAGLRLSGSLKDVLISTTLTRSPEPAHGRNSCDWNQNEVEASANFRSSKLLVPWTAKETRLSPPLMERKL